MQSSPPLFDPPAVSAQAESMRGDWRHCNWSKVVESDRLQVGYRGLGRPHGMEVVAYLQVGFVVMHKFARASRRMSTMAACTEKSFRPRLGGIVFDLDGCLTVQGAIDFVEMRRRAGVPAKANILECIDSMGEAERKKAMQAVLDVEAEGLERMRVRDHLDELFALLDRKGLKRAVLTRNTYHAINHFCKLSGRTFDDALDRSFERPKPYPDALLEICSRWKFTPEQVVMVGDHGDDIECGRRAGSLTIQILDDKVGGDADQDGPHRTPDYVVFSLREMTDVIENLAQGPSQRL